MSNERIKSDHGYIHDSGREATGNPLFGTFTTFESTKKPLLTEEISKFTEHTDQSLRPTSLWVKTGRVEKGEVGPGCAIGCIYCNQTSLDRDTQGDKIAGYLSAGIDAGISINSRLMVGNRVDQEISIEDLVGELDNYTYYEQTSPIILENFNDPGMNWDKTIGLAKRIFTEKKHTGPMIFITKMGMSERVVREVKQLQEAGGKPIVVVTYSGLPREIEPVSKKSRQDTMKRLHDANIPVVLSIRPLIEGINATEDSIRQIFEETKENVNLYTTGGLFVYQDFTSEAFAKAGYQLPQSYTDIDYPVAKILPDEVRNMVREVAKVESVDVPIHDHTSCAVSHIMTINYSQDTPDRLAHWSGEVAPKFDSYCSNFCDARQMVVCQEKSKQPAEEVIKLVMSKLEKIGYKNYEVIASTTQSGLLLIRGDDVNPGSLLIEQLFAVSESAGWYVNNLPSHEGLVHRSRQALEEDLGLSVFEEVFLGAILAGQEWFVFLKGKVDEYNNELATRWMRSRNRARIQVVNVDDLSDSKKSQKIQDNLISNLNEDGEQAEKDKILKQLSVISSKT